MPEFVLDMRSPDGAKAFAALDSFTQGYLEAAFFTESNDLYDSDEWDSEQAQEDIREGRCGGEIPGDSSIADIAPEALASAIEDCAAFQEKAAALLESAYERDYDSEQAGRDFWYTRNGHGVGFWERKALEQDSPEYEALTAEMIANRDNNEAWNDAFNRRAQLPDSLGDKLSDVARSFGEVNFYRGDDSRLYFS